VTEFIHGLRSYLHRHDLEGQAMVEYALIIVLVVVVLILVVMVLGNTVKNLYSNSAAAAQH
jgi:Flp pilus assembly pilin Flp